MNIYMREALLGGWHLLPEVKSERPKEVVREKPVWVDDARFPKRQCADYSGAWADGVIFPPSDPPKIKAATPTGCECGFGNKNIPHTCSAAAPIDGLRVGDVARWCSRVVTLTKSLEAGLFFEFTPGPICNGGTAHASDLKLLGRPGPDGWIPHKPGDPCPVPDGTRVHVKLRDSNDDGGMAWSMWQWTELPHYEHNEIIGWRLA